MVKNFKKNLLRSETFNCYPEMLAFINDFSQELFCMAACEQN